MSAVTIIQMTDRVSALIEERLGIRGRTLEDKVRKAGRRLPKKVRLAAAALADAQKMAQNPKLLVQLDEGEVAANYDTCIRHLGGINRGAARKSAVLGAAASAAFAIFIVMLLAIAVIYWRGLI